MVKRIFLTASGGAFRDLPLSQLAQVTPAQACTHPNWNMGRKVTVDSATMMNKGLEVIEAHWLFGLPVEKIEVLLHPQSAVHSLVEYSDGSMLAQLGNPDMRTPIAHALAWPDRIESGVKSLDLIALKRLDFMEMDRQRYPCLDLAYTALKTGGTATTILNAANEIAVAAFLNNQIKFTDIATIVAKVLDKLPGNTAQNLEIIMQDDARAREMAMAFTDDDGMMRALLANSE
jgi:1-deoxy-D-xylulose-5-phosphate reductoisomerase